MSPAPPAEPPSSEPKGRTTTLILCLFFGGFGIHRFYTGYTIPGLIQMFTAGLCGIWWAVDLYMILAGRYRTVDGQALV